MQVIKDQWQIHDYIETENCFECKFFDGGHENVDSRWISACHYQNTKKLQKMLVISMISFVCKFMCHYGKWFLATCILPKKDKFHG